MNKGGKTININGAAMNIIKDAVPMIAINNFSGSGIKCHINESVDGGLALNLGGLVKFNIGFVEN